MATHSSILAWRISWTEEPAGYSPWGRKELDLTEPLNTDTHVTIHRMVEILSCPQHMFPAEAKQGCIQFFCISTNAVKVPLIVVSLMPFLFLFFFHFCWWLYSQLQSMGVTEPGTTEWLTHMLFKMAPQCRAAGLFRLQRKSWCALRRKIRVLGKLGAGTSYSVVGREFSVNESTISIK